MQEELAQAYDAGISRRHLDAYIFQWLGNRRRSSEKLRSLPNKPALRVCGDYSVTGNPQLNTSTSAATSSGTDAKVERWLWLHQDRPGRCLQPDQVRSKNSWKARPEHSSRISNSERTSFRNQFRPWLLPASNGWNYQWSAQCSHLPGRHSLQWCNSGSPFTESAPSTKASWQRTAVPPLKMHLRSTTSGSLGARAVQWRNSPGSKGQCPQRDAVRAILRQVFASHFCFSGRTAIPSYQERQSVGMRVRRGSSLALAEGTLIYIRCVAH